jgi:hypothetical protein
MLFYLLLLYIFIFFAFTLCFLCLCIVGHSLVINEQTVSIHALNGELKLRQCGEACDRVAGGGEVRK